MLQLLPTNLRVIDSEISKSMRYSLVLLSFLLIGLMGCSGGGSQSETSADTQSESTTDLLDLKEKEVMKVHDDAMAKMGQLTMKSKQIKDYVDSLSAISITQYADQIQQLSKANQDLAQADDGMMNWMRNYALPSEGSDEEKMSYLNQQLEKMVEVSKAMDDALQQADDLLGTATID